MGRFVASPEVLHASGQKMLGQSEQFAQNNQKIYQTVQKMVNTNYVSPEAKAIANEIFSYKEDLDKMTRTISHYGSFCVNASSKVIQNQENIISGI